MTSWLDKTYCMSPNCKNECGRKMPNEYVELLKRIKWERVAWAYFCGEPEND